MAHVLDHLEQYTADWIDWLQLPDDANKGSYTGPRCPFSKKAKDDGRMKLVKVLTISVLMTIGKLYPESVKPLMAVMIL